MVGRYLGWSGSVVQEPILHTIVSYIQRHEKTTMFSSDLKYALAYYVELSVSPSVTSGGLLDLPLKAKHRVNVHP
jgi:hypothetical protein